MWLDLGLKGAVRVPFLFPASCSSLLRGGSYLRLPLWSGPYP